jgi:two-component sensor histidine kinase/putative methionine-R-sulfoxide reductase with GAF domain
MAAAIQNARLFEQTQAALANSERLAERERIAAEQVMALNRRLTREGWAEYATRHAGELVGKAELESAAAGANGQTRALAPAGNGSGNGNANEPPTPPGKIKVPIVLRGEVLGDVELEYDDLEHDWSEDRQELVNDVVENLGLALDNARLFTESQRRVTELDALNSISQAMTTELELESLLNTIGDQLRTIFDVENTYIALYNRETQMISLPYFVNDNQRVKVEPMVFGEGITSHIIRTREPLVINDHTEQVLESMGAKVLGNPARSYLGVPILVGEDVTGVISIQSVEREGMFDDSNVRLMETIAATVGAAIQNAQLYGAMQQEVVVRQRAEEEIKLSLREKEVLLKEIHHRVKNNLQIITSLLNLQSAQLKDPESLTLFRESQFRVRSMALIHEKLYQSKDLARIEFDSYVRDLMVYLFRSYAANPDQIRMRIETNDIYLGIDTAIPCGLIISELVTNTIKYAFPGGRRGELHVGLVPEANGYLTLVVEDNGIGLPQDFDWRESDSLGLQLVNTLSSQLHGDIQVSGEGGTSFRITFLEV